MRFSKRDEPSYDPIEEREQIENLLDEAAKKIDILVGITFRRKEIFDAWMYKNVYSMPIRQIASAQGLSRGGAAKRLKVADRIMLNFQSTLHKIDDM